MTRQTRTFITFSALVINLSGLSV